MVAPLVGMAATAAAQTVKSTTLDPMAAHGRFLAQGGWKNYTGAKALVGEAQMPEYLPYDFGKINPQSYKTTWGSGRGFQKQGEGDGTGQGAGAGQGQGGIAGQNQQTFGRNFDRMRQALPSGPQGRALGMGGRAAGVTGPAYPNAREMQMAGGELGTGRLGINPGRRSVASRQALTTPAGGRITPLPGVKPGAMMIDTTARTGATRAVGGQALKALGPGSARTAGKAVASKAAGAGAAKLASAALPGPAKLLPMAAKQLKLF